MRFTNPLVYDTDGDGESDGYEVMNGYNPLDPASNSWSYYDPGPGYDPMSDSYADPDEDGLTNETEWSYGTNPMLADTDGDGLSDYDEVHGIEVTYEYQEFSYTDYYYDETTGETTTYDHYNTYFYQLIVHPNPLNPDSDGDLLPDGYEHQHGLNPTDSSDGLTDIDNDGLTRGREYQLGTDPMLADTDGDGINDGVEVANGTDPLDPLDPAPVPDPNPNSDPEPEPEPSVPPVPGGDGGDGQGQDGEEDGDGPGGGDQGTEDGAPEIDPALLQWSRVHGIPPGEVDGDRDGDGLSDREEFTLGTNPWKWDTDGDGVSDYREVRGERHPTYVSETNWSNASASGLFLHEWTDPETGEIHSSYEPWSSPYEPPLFRSDPLSVDTDGDGYSDGWEWSRLFDPGDPFNLVSPDGWSLPEEFVWRYPEITLWGDEDSDGLSNAEEFVWRTDPFDPDTDGDGYRDGEEVFGVMVVQTSRYSIPYTYDYVDPETGETRQYESEYWEESTYTNTIYGLDPAKADTDGDGLPDRFEVEAGLSPLSAYDGNRDQDRDGLTFGQEYRLGTSDELADTDGDGIDDGTEVALGRSLVLLGLPPFDPTDPSDGAADYDGDGISNAIEITVNGTNFLHYDTDGDGYHDNTEIYYGTDPLDPNDPPRGVAGGRQSAGTIAGAYFDAVNGWSRGIRGGAGGGSGGAGGEDGGGEDDEPPHPYSQGDGDEPLKVRTRVATDTLERVGFLLVLDDRRLWFAQRETTFSSNGLAVKTSEDENGRTTTVEHSWSASQVSVEAYPANALYKYAEEGVLAARPDPVYTSALQWTDVETVVQSDGESRREETSFSGSAEDSTSTDVPGTLTTEHGTSALVEPSAVYYMGTKTYPPESVTETDAAVTIKHDLGLVAGSGWNSVDATGSWTERYTDRIANSEMVDRVFGADLDPASEEWGASSAYSGLYGEGAVAVRYVNHSPPSAEGGDVEYVHAQDSQYQLTLRKADGGLYHWTERIIYRDEPDREEVIHHYWVANSTQSQVYSLSDKLVTEKKEGWVVATAPGKVEMELKIMKPETSTDAEWTNETFKWRMSTGGSFGKWEPFNFDDGDSFKLKLVSTTELNQEVVNYIKFEVAAFDAEPTTNPNWVKIAAKDFGKLSPDKKEIWCTIPAARIKIDVLPQEKPDSTSIESFSFDFPTTGTFIDSDAFDTEVDADTDRSVNVRMTGNWASNSITTSDGTIAPWTAAVGKELIVHGGGIYIAARMPEGDEQRAVAKNQADWMYLSTHGHSATGVIDVGPGAKVAPAEVKWQEDLDLVIIAGCSVLDINDYNGHYDDDGDGVPEVGPSSKVFNGEIWAGTGPKHFLGYNYEAPKDDQNSDKIIKDWAANQKSLGVVAAWMEANNNSNGRNACAIESGVGYWYIDRTPGFLGLPKNKITFIPVTSW